MRYENGCFTGTVENCNSKLKKYKVSYFNDTQDFVSPDDFDDVEVILGRLLTRTAFHYKLKCISRNKQTIVMSVIQNTPSSIWINLQLFTLFYAFI